MAWFDEGSITNIISFSSIRDKYPIRYETEGNYFYIVKPYKEILFRQSPSGIYFYNTYNRDVVLINTILDIREGFYQRLYDSVKKALHALRMVGYPSEKDFKNIVCSRMISNLPVTLDDINNSNEIFGPDIPLLKLKMGRRQPNHVVSNYVKITK